MKVAFACPTYGPIEAMAAHSQREAISHAWAHGVEVCMDLWRDRMFLTFARTSIVHQFLEDERCKDFDGIFWHDFDVLLPHEAIWKLCREDLDVVTGVVHVRGAPYIPMLFARSEGEDLKQMHPITEWPSDRVFEVAAHGFGCLYTSRRALEASFIEDEGPEKEDRMCFRLVHRWTEDTDWCYRMATKGIKLWCDPTVNCGHLDLSSPRIAGLHSFLDHKDKNPGEFHPTRLMVHVDADGNQILSASKGQVG